MAETRERSIEQCEESGACLRSMTCGRIVLQERNPEQADGDPLLLLPPLSQGYVAVEQSFVVKPGEPAAADVYRAFVADVIRSGFVKASLDCAKLSTATAVARAR